MITEENKLHNIDLLKQAVLKNFEELKLKYEYEDFGEYSKYNTNDSIYLAIIKKEIILYAFISIREAYEISIIKKGKEKYESVAFNSLLYRKFAPLSEELKEFLKNKQLKLKQFEKFSFEYYYNSILTDILFLIKNYPMILKDGLFKF